MHIGFTGTQRGMTEEQWEIVKNLVSIWYRQRGTEYLHVHHGTCIGADEQFHNICVVPLFIHITGHPPIKKSKQMGLESLARISDLREPKDYLIRNRDIVDECNILVACPGERTEQVRSGTWATVRYARKIGKPVILVLP